MGGDDFDDRLTCRPVWLRRRVALSCWRAYSSPPTEWAPCSPEPSWEPLALDDESGAAGPLPALVEHVAGPLVLADPEQVDRIRGHLGAVSLREVVVRALEHERDSLRERYHEAWAEDPEDLRRYPTPETVWVVLGATLRSVAVNPDLIDEIYGLMLEPREQRLAGLSSVIARALVRFADHLQSRARHDVPGSTAPPIRPWRPPVPVEPVPAAEARATVQAWLRRGRRI